MNFIQFRDQNMTSLLTSCSTQDNSGKGHICIEQERKYSYPCCGRVAYIGFLSTLDYGKSESTLEA